MSGEGEPSGFHSTFSGRCGNCESSRACRDPGMRSRWSLGGWRGLPLTGPPRSRLRQRSSEWSLYRFPAYVGKRRNSPAIWRLDPPASVRRHGASHGFRSRHSSPSRDSISTNCTLPFLTSLETRNPPRANRRKEAFHWGGQAGKTRMTSGSPGRGDTLCSSASCRIIVSRPRCSIEWAW